MQACSPPVHLVFKTWLADANAAGTSMTWDTAIAWAAGLNVAGVTGWRLPDTIDVGNDGNTFTNSYEGVDYGYNITTHSELSNMFYNVLGNLAFIRHRRRNSSRLGTN